GGGFGPRFGGNRQNREPGGPPGGGRVGRGPDFFESRDTEVPQQTLLYDPYEEMMSRRQAAGPAEAPQVLDSVRLASGADAPKLPDAVLAQAKTPMPPVPVTGPGGVDLILPRGTVTATPLGEFGAVIITANNQADLELVRQILRQLEEYLRREAAAGPKLEVIELQYADAVEMVNLLNQLSARATYGPAAQRQQPGGGGFPFGGAVGQPQAQQLGGGGSVFLLPLARRNAALMFGPDLRFPYYRELIKQPDTKNTNLPIPIKLKKASAQLVANQLTQFYNQRYNAAGETSANNLTPFTYHTTSTTLFVHT